MLKQDFVKQHLRLALLGAIAEADGNEAVSRSMHADTQRRLISMSDEELWQLANLTTSPSKASVELAYDELKGRVKTLAANSNDQIEDIAEQQPE